MKTTRLYLLGALLFVAAFSPGLSLAAHWSLSPLLPANPLAGSQLFTEKGCLQCHSIHGTGGVTGPDLGRGILNRPLLDIAGVMWNHSPGMEHIFQERRATRPKFAPGEMANLLGFLYYLGSLDPVGDPEVGGRLFREKRCDTCHSLGGAGGAYAPRLDKYSRYASPIFLTVGLWNRGKAMAEQMEVLNVPRTAFARNEIADLFAYIRSVGGGVDRIYVQPGNPQRGEKLFSAKRCIECHSVMGHGGRDGPDLRASLRGSMMNIAGAMWNHGPNMWASMTRKGIQVPLLTTEDLSDLISYLYFLQFIDPPGNAERGRDIYREKRCGVCHGSPGGAGGVVGLDLTRVEQLKTPLELVTEMWNHASTMEQKMLEQSVEWPFFKSGEMADVIAYLLSLRRDR